MLDSSFLEYTPWGPKLHDTLAAGSSMANIQAVEIYESVNFSIFLKKLIALSNYV